MSPGRSGLIGAGTAGQRMLNPNGALQRLGPWRVTARTWAYSENGCPVIQGSEIGTATVGAGAFFVDQTIELSENVGPVASSNW